MLQLVFAFTKTADGKLAFGNKNGLPWPKNKQDMANFKNNTLFSNVIMGAKTFKSLPSKLLQRNNIVVCNPDKKPPMTKSGEYPDYIISKNEVDKFFQKKTWIDPFEKEKSNLPSLEFTSHNLWSVIGGITLIEKAFKYCDTVIMTEIFINLDFKLTVDTFLPEDLYKSIVDDFYLEKSTIFNNDSVSINEMIFKKNI